MKRRTAFDFSESIRKNRTIDTFRILYIIPNVLSTSEIKEQTMKTIVFAGGGTAGHVIPNLALIGALKHKYNCVYVGGDGMERSLCDARGIPFYEIETVKLRRDKKLGNIAVPFKLISCVKSAKRVLEKIKPDLIFSKGGFAALPVVLAAKRVPVISHESDFSPGLTTKLTKRKSKRILCSFSDCANTIKRAEHCGAPLDPALYNGHRDKSAYGLNGNKPVLTVIGGSSGAAALNACTVDALPTLLKTFDVIHVTGKNKSGGQKQTGYCPVEFETDMPKLYATSDLIVTRAGANALAECVALRIPTLAVPLEKASRGDQVQNARYFEDLGAIKVMRECDMTGSTLPAAALGLYNGKSKYIATMSTMQPDGTTRICEIIESELKEIAGS